MNERVDKTAELSRRASIGDALIYDHDGVGGDGSRKEMVDSENVPRRVLSSSTTEIWIDHQIDFFGRFPECRVQSVARLGALVESGSITPEIFHAQYDEILVQYDALRPIMESALQGRGVKLPTRKAFLALSPGEHRKLDAEVALCVENMTQVQHWLAPLAARLAVLTQAVETYKDVADVYKEKLPQPAPADQALAAK